MRERGKERKREHGTRLRTQTWPKALPINYVNGLSRRRQVTFKWQRINQCSRDCGKGRERGVTSFVELCECIKQRN